MYSAAARAICDRLEPLKQRGVAIADQPATNRAVGAVQVNAFYESSTYSRPDRPTNNHSFEQIESCQFLVELVFRDIRDHYSAQDLIQQGKQLLSGFSPAGAQKVPTEGVLYFGRSSFGRLSDNAGWLYNITCSFDTLLTLNLKESTHGA